MKIQQILQKNMFLHVFASISQNLEKFTQNKEKTIKSTKIQKFYKKQQKNTKLPKKMKN